MWGPGEGRRKLNTMAAFILIFIFFSLVYCTGVNIGVEVLGGGSVRVEWRVVEGVNQYNVKLNNLYGPTGQSVMVDCLKEVCGVTFNEVSDGSYEAEVSYSRQMTTTNTTTKATTSHTFNLQGHKQDCRLPFLNIAGRCFMMETVNLASWYDMKQHCLQFGGQLANLDNANILYYVIKYIYDQSLSGHDFWIGASDEGSEGTFKWLDGTNVKLNSPYWGYNDHTHEPNGGTLENCGAIMKQYYFDFNDSPCTEMYAGVCEQVD